MLNAALLVYLTRAPELLVAPLQGRRNGRPPPPPPPPLICSLLTALMTTYALSGCQTRSSAAAKHSRLTTTYSWLPCRPHAISPHPPLLPHRRGSTPKYWGHVPSPSLPYPHFLLLFPFPLLPTSLPLFSPALPLEVGALNTARESGGAL